MDTAKQWTVAVEGSARTVTGSSWVTALGVYLERSGMSMKRMAAETLPNGVVLVTDMEDGFRFVVRPGQTDFRAVEAEEEDTVMAI